MNKFKALGWSQKIGLGMIFLMILVLPLTLALLYRQTHFGSSAAGPTSTPVNNLLPTNSPCYSVYKEATCQNCCDPKYCVGAQNIRGCPVMTSGKNQTCSGGKICCYRCSTPAP